MQSVLRSLRAFELIAERQPVRLAELVPLLELSKSTVQRILRTLESAGWIEIASGDVTRWQVAPRPREALSAGRGPLRLGEAAAPVMAALRDDTGETVHLSVPGPGGRMVVVDHAESRHELRIVAPIGTVFDGTTTAGGLAVLAAAGETTGDAAADELVAAARRDGYCVRPAESGHTVGIGAAITDGSGAPVAAIVLVVPVLRYRVDDRARLGARVVDAATAITAVLASR
nr:helix-turn-helix domain-containing protein [Jiangella mangrovi]